MAYVRFWCVDLVLFVLHFLENWSVRWVNVSQKLIVIYDKKCHWIGVNGMIPVTSSFEMFYRSSNGPFQHLISVITRHIFLRHMRLSDDLQIIRSIYHGNFKHFSWLSFCETAPVVAVQPRSLILCCNDNNVDKTGHFKIFPFVYGLSVHLLFLRRSYLFQYVGVKFINSCIFTPHMHIIFNTYKYSA